MALPLFNSVTKSFSVSHASRPPLSVLRPDSPLYPTPCRTLRNTFLPPRCRQPDTPLGTAEFRSAPPRLAPPNRSGTGRTGATLPSPRSHRPGPKASRALGPSGRGPCPQGTSPCRGNSRSPSWKTGRSAHRVPPAGSTGSRTQDSLSCTSRPLPRRTRPPA